MRCKCNKRWYRDELAAQISLATIQKTDRPTCRELRAYRCPTSKGYHLTSQRRREAYTRGD